jgi:hypothetical protein
MNRENFVEILSSFSISDPIMRKDQFIIELPTGEIIEGKYSISDDGNLEKITENDVDAVPEIWIAERLGRLTSLARAIKNCLSDTKPFVSPLGKYSLNWSMGGINTGDESVCEKLLEICNTKNIWETHVLYLTSNAGEGKTTVLEKISTLQAERFQLGKGRLILPIPLAGKPFIRFEDIVIGTLVNRYKFSGYLYSSFITLIKMGFIIPAFDGFEEMFIESPTGEAISAMAEFIKDLKGSGLVLIAARTAYSESQNLTTQGKLYDSLSKFPVVFSTIKIDRWRKDEFIKYGEERAYTTEEIEQLYAKLGSVFPFDHPILTRAVLINKLFDSFTENGNIDDYLKIASSNYLDFYNQFLRKIIEREASKWLQKLKNESIPVLSIDQHYKLLSFIAKEMWSSKSETVKEDFLEMLADLFSETEKLNAEAAWQVKKRIKDHAVIHLSNKVGKTYEFDHQDFYQYFLGYSIYLDIKGKNIKEVFDIARRGRLSKNSIEAFAFSVINDGIECVDEIIACINMEQKTSFARENMYLMCILLFQNTERQLPIAYTVFESEPFDQFDLYNIIFKDCILTNIHSSNIKGRLEFINTKIIKFNIDDNEKKEIIINNETEINSLYVLDEDFMEYSPSIIKEKMSNKINTIFITDGVAQVFIERRSDEKLMIIEKVIRMFFNRIEVNEEHIRQKLSFKATQFFDDILPDIVDIIFEEVGYHGSGSQKRFRIICKLEKIQKAFELCNGDYSVFLDSLSKKKC